MTERQKYLRLLSIIIEDLPTSAVDAAGRALPSQIRAVIDWNQADTLVLKEQLVVVQQDRDFRNFR